MPRLLSEIARRDPIFFVGDFISCKIKGVPYKNAEITKIVDPYITLKTDKGTIEAYPSDIKLTPRTGMLESNSKNVYQEQAGVVFLLRLKTLTSIQPKEWPSMPRPEKTLLL